jgi:hypothetical protein
VQQHKAVLEKNGYVTLADVGELTRSDLLEMGIAKLKDRKAMVKLFAESGGGGGAAAASAELAGAGAAKTQASSSDDDDSDDSDDDSSEDSDSDDDESSSDEDPAAGTNVPPAPAATNDDDEEEEEEDDSSSEDSNSDDDETNSDEDPAAGTNVPPAPAATKDDDDEEEAAAPVPSEDDDNKDPDISILVFNNLAVGLGCGKDQYSAYGTAEKKLTFVGNVGRPEQAAEVVKQMGGQLRRAYSAQKNTTTFSIAGMADHNGLSGSLDNLEPGASSARSLVLSRLTGFAETQTNALSGTKAILVALTGGSAAGATAGGHIPVYQGGHIAISRKC